MAGLDPAIHLLAPVFAYSDNAMLPDNMVGERLKRLKEMLDER